MKWRQVLPGARADGSAFAQSGCSTLVYAGDGKFCYEEDLLNMTHFFEDIYGHDALLVKVLASGYPYPG